MINIRSRKSGFVLIMVIVFILTAIITTYALHVLVSSNYSVLGTNTASNMEGYYAEVAGLRYVSVMLTDAAVVNQLTNTGIYGPISISSAYPSLYADLKLKAPHDVTITITATPPAYGNIYTEPYTANASYD